MKLRNILVFAFILSSLIVNAQEIQENKKPITPHNFSMDLGYSYRLSAEPNELFNNQTYSSDYYSTLRNGFQINFAYDYSFKENFAFGFKTSAFTSYNALSSEAEILGNSGVEHKDDMYILYIGPSFKYITPVFSEKYLFYARATIGYMSLRNSETKSVFNSSNGQTSPLSSVYTGGCFGWGLDTGLDYIFNDFLSLGFNLGLLGGNVNKLNLGEDTYNLDHSESLYRLDLSVGVRIRL